MKQVTSTEASRDFPKLLRAVAQGERVQINSHGRPMAVLLPAPAQRSPSNPAALQLLERLNAQTSTGAPRDWQRDDLYA
jgi:prevent-host-death family protein